MTKSSRTAESREKGQAIILIVFAFIGLLAAVGIVVDLGRYLVAQTQLRRAVDAAALAGAAQFRLAGSTSTEAAVYDKVNKAARSSLSVSGVPTETLDCPTCTVIDTKYTVCPLGPDCPAFDTNPPTKKVRVHVDDTLPLIFLSLIGWREVGITAESTTEAASVDVALVLDISDSMASDSVPSCTGAGNNYYYCVHQCDTSTANPLNTECYPFYQVKEAARSFIDYLSPGFDRVTVIPFGLYAGYCIYPGDDPPNWFCPSGYDPPSGLTGDKYVPLTINLDSARAFIDNLDLAIPDWAGSPPPQDPGVAPPCTNYTDNPPPGPGPEDWDPRQCTNTNIGGGIKAAATELLKEFDPLYPGGGPNHPSKERLRVVVLLTDGAANASGLGPELGMPDYDTGLQLGYCPQYTWYSPPPAGPFCRAPNPVLIGPGRHISTSFEYDAVDYALDWSDFAMLESPVGNSIVMFTIGLGSQVTSGVGEDLLRYIAAGGDDGDLATNPCAGAPSGNSCGNYYFAPSGAQLLQVFKSIAGRIFTRINQ